MKETFSAAAAAATERDRQKRDRVDKRKRGKIEIAQGKKSERASEISNETNPYLIGTRWERERPKQVCDIQRIELIRLLRKCFFT